MKSEVKLPVVIAACVIVGALFFFVFTRAMKAGDLDQGQVKYTPGVPPWMEKDPGKAGVGTVAPGVVRAPSSVAKG